MGISIGGRAAKTTLIAASLAGVLFTSSATVAADAADDGSADHDCPAAATSPVSHTADRAMIPPPLPAGGGPG